jgi:hypothetical protein
MENISSSFFSKQAENRYRLSDNYVRKLPQIRDNDVIIDLATSPDANDVIITVW